MLLILLAGGRRALEVARPAAPDVVARAHLDAVALVGAGELVLERRHGVEVGRLALGVAGAAAAAVEALRFV